MKTLATRLAWARAKAGLSQEELAKRASVSQSTIGNLEAGLRFTARKIAVIAAAVGVNALWLETGKGDPLAASSTNELTDKELQLILAYREASEEGKNFIEMACSAAPRGGKL